MTADSAVANSPVKGLHNRQSSGEVTTKLTDAILFSERFFVYEFLQFPVVLL